MCIRDRINAELPTEPTELADPVDETQKAEDGAEGEEEKAYEPSEAEVAAAMAEAKVKADEAVKTSAKVGELRENATKYAIPSHSLT